MNPAATSAKNSTPAVPITITAAGAADALRANRNDGEAQLHDGERGARARRRPPAVDELVVHVAPVAGERRLPRAEPAEDRDHGLERGQCDQRERREPDLGPAVRHPRGGEQQRERGADEVRAGVAEVDARGRPVEPEEPADRARDCERGAAAVTAEQRGEPRRADQGDAGCERVEAVEHVDRVDEHDDHDDDRERSERRSETHGHDRGGDSADDDLAEQPRRCREAARVVDQSQQRGEAEWEQQGG